MASTQDFRPPHHASGEIIEAARALADDVLFPAALAIDRAVVVPGTYLDQLAAAGFYGLFGPVDAGGIDADPTTGARVIEALGGASLATAFVWIQHHSALRAVAAARPSLRRHWLPALSSGRVRAGVAIASLRRSGPPPLVAERVGDGWVFDGAVPWITGWDMTDVAYVGARHGDDIVWALVDTCAGATLRPRPLDLAAVRSSATVAVRFARHVVADQRVVDIEPYVQWRERDRQGLRTNGYLAIGVAARCARLLCSERLGADVDEARAALDTADGLAVVGARAAAAVLAMRAATALVVQGGGRSLELDHHGQRLGREAMFLLVFGQTADIKAAELATVLGDGG